MLGSTKRAAAASAAEWTQEADSMDEEGSRKWRRNCHRNSSSSGYSSGHSPPLSAASGGQAALAVIREGEAIPRPIWPSPQSTPTPNSSCCTDVERRPASINGSGGDYGPAAWGSSLSLNSDRELLLELSRTLSAVLEGGSVSNAGQEQMLRRVSRRVAAVHQARAPACAVYEEICPYARAASCLSNESAAASSIGLVNPINSSLYQPTRTSMKEKRMSHIAGRRRPYFFRLLKSFSVSQLSSSSGQQTTGRKRQCTPPTGAQLNDNSSASWNCNNSLGWSNNTSEKLSSNPIFGKSASNQNDLRGNKEIRLNYPSIIQHEYTTLECSDTSSSDGGAVSKDNTWSKNFRGFDKNLDFTLDGFKAERLGRAIAKAKRRRQWCRVLVVMFGLVFFILSVVIVSLSLTKGRKVFGSM